MAGEAGEKLAFKAAFAAWWIGRRACRRVKGTRREVLSTMGLALALLLPCLAAWFAGASGVGWLPARLATPLIDKAAGHVVAVERMGTTVAYTVRVEGAYRPGGSSAADVKVEVSSATYTFGIAVFVALALASGGWRRPARMALGAAILLPLPAIGIAFDALRQLAAAPVLAELLGWPVLAREALAFGYQASSLLLPTLAPIAVWLLLFWLSPRPAACEHADSPDLLKRR